jgi:hypothetical protein
MRYYFDILDSAELAADEIGIECASENAAISEALRSLADWANDSTTAAGSRAILIIVRDEHREVARLRLRLQIELAPLLAGAEIQASAPSGLPEQVGTHQV